MIQPEWCYKEVLLVLITPPQGVRRAVFISEILVTTASQRFSPRCFSFHTLPSSRSFPLPAPGVFVFAFCPLPFLPHHLLAAVTTTHQHFHSLLLSALPWIAPQEKIRPSDSPSPGSSSSVGTSVQWHPQQFQTPTCEARGRDLYSIFPKPPVLQGKTRQKSFSSFHGIYTEERK